MQKRKSAIDDSESITTQEGQSHTPEAQHASSEMFEAPDQQHQGHRMLSNHDPETIDHASFDGSGHDTFNSTPPASDRDLWSLAADLMPTLNQDSTPAMHAREPDGPGPDRLEHTAYTAEPGPLSEDAQWTHSGAESHAWALPGPSDCGPQEGDHFSWPESPKASGGTPDSGSDDGGF